VLAENKLNVQLIAILLIGAALRLWRIDQPFEDAFSWRQADDATIADNFFRGHWNIFLPMISWNGPGENYVGYEFQLTTYIAAMLYHVFGQHDWVARSVGVAFGLWGIFAFFRLTDLLFGRSKALVCAAILAVAPGAVFTDRSFLPDPVMLSLILTCVWLFVAHQQNNTSRDLVLSGFSGALGCLTKLTGAIVGLPVVYLWARELPPLLQARTAYILKYGAAGLAVAIPIVGYYSFAVYVSRTYPPYHVGANGNWLWDESLWKWVRQGYFLREFGHTAGLFWGKPLLALALIGLVAPKTSNQPKAPHFFFHVWLASGVILYTFAARELVHNPWNFHILTPALAGLAAHGTCIVANIASTAISAARTWVVTIVVGAIAVIGSVNLQWLYAGYARQTVELGHALRRVSEPSDLVVTIGSAVGEPGAIYYSGRAGWVFPPAGTDVDWSSLFTDDDEGIRHFQRLTCLGAEWFGIVGDQRKALAEATPKLWQHIVTSSKLVEENPQWSIYQIQGPCVGGK
jgi:4-amino-4-deoxy-L-arabinose transferase-like glycosyltransferase